MNPATTSSASAQPGTMRGLTNEAAWIWCSPVSASASINLILSAVPIGPGSIWNPSRGPSSWISTCFGRSVMLLILGKDGSGSSYIKPPSCPIRCASGGERDPELLEIGGDPLAEDADLAQIPDQPLVQVAAEKLAERG